MDPDIAQLVHEERLLEAAAMASARGDSHLASQLYERACDWANAAAEAIRARDGTRALEMAAEAGDDTLADQALGLVPRDASEAIAAKLAHRGHERWAARLLEAGGHTVAAARLWERAGQATRAAVLLERAGDPAGAARVLEAGLRRDPGAWSVATALGALLARFGKHAAAVRVLQRVPEGAPQRREALVHLVPALEQLGLDQAAADASTELETHGGGFAEEASPPPPELHPRVFGRYDVVREVASSPSARVLECVDVVRGERVAVKVFAAWDTHGTGRDALTRFEREVRTMRALDHPSIVPYRDYVAEGPAIVLAWMAGGTLERMLATTGALAPARAVEIATGVLVGARRGAPPRDPAPRREARQRSLRRGGRRAPERLRRRAPGGRVDDRDRGRLRDARVHEPRAARRTTGDGAERRLRGRDASSRDAHRRATLARRGPAPAAERCAPRARARITTPSSPA